MDVIVQYAGGSRFIAQARQHRVVLDQPFEDGASDSGMTPAELLLAALAGCAGQFAAQYLKLRSLPVEGLLVRAVAERSGPPVCLDDFHVEIVVPGLERPHLQALQESFPAGMVHNTLRNQPSLTVLASTHHHGDIPF